MSHNHSVSRWIASLRGGELRDATHLWNRYCERLGEIVGHRLASFPTSVIDEQDVLQNVFFSLCRGITGGRFDDIKNRDELWWLMLHLARKKAIDAIRHETAEKRGKGRVRNESAFRINEHSMNTFSFDQLVSELPSPEFVAVLDDELNHFLLLLRDDELRRIALLRLEGYSVAEVAEQIGISRRSVERKLHLIREMCAREVFHGVAGEDFHGPSRWASDR